MNNVIDFEKFPLFYPTIKDGVVVITRDGKVLVDDLEEMPYNHATLTNYFAYQLGLSYSETLFPLIAGCEASNQGVLVLHIHKDGICIVYFPIWITEIQYDLLVQILEHKKDLKCQYLECEQEEGYVLVEQVLEYANKIVSLENGDTYLKSRTKNRNHI